MRKLKYLLTFLLIISLAPLAAQDENDDMYLFLTIQDLYRGTTPILYKDKIILSYSVNKPVRHVGAVFAHEEYRTLHSFQVNSKGVFYLLMDAPENVSELVYRIVIDGLWTTDPNNSMTLSDDKGTELSRLPLEIKTEDTIASPLIKPNSAEFYFSYEEGKNIWLTGSFVSWNPYQLKMKEVEPGLYYLRVRLLPGQYDYAFFDGVNQILDPLNSSFAYKTDGRRVSRFKIADTPLAAGY